MCVYIFREYIRNNVADEMSSVASKSLADESVKMKAQELSVALLNAILNDANVHRQSGIVKGDDRSFSKWLP